MLPTTSFNDLAYQYRTFLKPFDVRLPTNWSPNGVTHIEGTFCAYECRIELVGTNTHVFHYLGHSKQPRLRLSKHKSEFFSGRCAPFVGKSTLYDPVLLVGLRAVNFDLIILQTGLSEEDAKAAEDRNSAAYRERFGTYVLTNPRRGKAMA